jgi:putative transposase
MVEWAAVGGEIDLKYLDESGFCAWSEPTYTYLLQTFASKNGYNKRRGVVGD